jgi:hypothetical protein
LLIIVLSILKLNMQLEASLSRCSHLYARLLSTLDTLDHVQSELGFERRRNDEELTTRKAWKEKIKELERERDEMKEVVEILIKKGTFCRNCDRLLTHLVNILVFYV